MAPAPIPRTGGQMVVDALKIHGVDHAFCVPGESFLPVLDALHAASGTIRTIVCRQEGAAAHMAEAYGKLTGKPGICLVTRGPGATNASIGVHTARHDSTPMILLVGQVGTDCLEREAWQEIDVRRTFGALAKWATQIDHLERMPELLSRAFHVATSGRPGPVVIALPEDLLYRQIAVPDAGVAGRTAAHAGDAQMKSLRELLAAARRPVLILGGGGWNAQACDGIAAFAEAFGLPVGTAFRRQDLFDNTHAQYAGDIGSGINPRLAQRLRDADLVIAAGARLSETTTAGYTLFDIPKLKAAFVHIHPDVEELGKVYHPDLAINAGMPEFARAARALAPAAAVSWGAWTASARDDYLERLAPVPTPGRLNLSEVVTHIRRHVPADTIVTNGAGNYASWVHRFYQYRGFRTQLAPTSGVMGYGTPAACAAALVHPDRRVICFAGDGCFLMNSQELATAKQYGLRIIFIVVNNGMYGSIRMHQEIHYPGRVFGTTLENPDFPALASSYGLEGFRVERTEDFPACFGRALEAERGALIELRIDPEAIKPQMTLTELRNKSLAR
ncbi:thiamine pyrophosphate-binding protein [Pigmentiphaga soli]|uniref:Thiamine pyrophosphate-binding protein n=1 Tax=Pigmentiphaga soli TaxID=1007095 RepID=A0ABP8HS57_9BURK